MADLDFAMSPEEMEDIPRMDEIDDDLEAEQEGLAWDKTIEKATAAGLGADDIAEKDVYSALAAASTGVTVETEKTYLR